jgi:uncharacterized membrane protein YfcA
VLPDRILLGAIALIVLYGAVELVRKPDRDAERSVRSPMLSAAAIGFGVGVLGGIVGLILGSLRLPAMIRWAGLTPYAVVGTNAAVGVVVGVGGLVGHLPSGVDWDLLAVGCAGAIPGAYAGAGLTGRLDERTLLKAMAAVLVISGLAMLVQAVVG